MVILIFGRVYVLFFVEVVWVVFYLMSGKGSGKILVYDDILLWCHDSVFHLLCDVGVDMRGYYPERGLISCGQISGFLRRRGVCCSGYSNKGFLVMLSSGLDCYSYELLSLLCLPWYRNLIVQEVPNCLRLLGVISLWDELEIEFISPSWYDPGVGQWSWGIVEQFIEVDFRFDCSAVSEGSLCYTCLVEIRDRWLSCGFDLDMLRKVFVGNDSLFVV